MGQHAVLPQQYLMHDAPIGQDGEYRLAAFRDLRLGSRYGPLVAQRLHGRFVQVVHIELASRSEQVERHGPAHDPQSHKSDFHIRIPPCALFVQA